MQSAYRKDAKSAKAKVMLDAEGRTTRTDFDKLFRMVPHDFRLMPKMIVRRLSAYCLAPLAGMALVSYGCATPIGVVRGTTQDIHHALTANVLSSGEPSSWSDQVLQRSNLYDRFREDEEAAL